MFGEQRTDGSGLADWQTMAAPLRQRFRAVDHVATTALRRYELLKPRNPDELINEDDFNRDERLPYWADVWPSALCLAERLAAEAGSGRRLLELGCGVGYVCLVAAAAGFDVLATDYYAEALEFTRLNARRNNVREPAVRLVDWRELPDDLGRFDVVAAADVLYEKAYPALVAEAFRRTLADRGLGLMADPGRRGAEVFALECRKRGLCCQRLSRAPFDNGSVQHTVDLYEIRRRA